MRPRCSRIDGTYLHGGEKINRYPESLGATHYAGQFSQVIMFRNHI